jgi:hypothetical protein
LSGKERYEKEKGVAVRIDGNPFFFLMKVLRLPVSVGTGIVIKNGGLFQGKYAKRGSMIVSDLKGFRMIGAGSQVCHV